jgi:hypothetical protein
MAHELALERPNLHGHSRGLEPVLTVDAGESVSISVPNAGRRIAAEGMLPPMHGLHGVPCDETLTLDVLRVHAVLRDDAPR